MAAVWGAGGGGFNSCVISPFKFHKQLNILCAFFRAFLLSRGEDNEDRRRDKVAAAAAAVGGSRSFFWRLVRLLERGPPHIRRRGEHLGRGEGGVSSSSAPPNNYGFIVIML